MSLYDKISVRAVRTKEGIKRYYVNVKMLCFLYIQDTQNDMIFGVVYICTFQGNSQVLKRLQYIDNKSFQIKGLVGILYTSIFASGKHNLIFFFIIHK